MRERIEEQIEKLRERWPLKAVVTLAVGIAVAFVYWLYVPGPDADGVVVPARVVAPAAPSTYDPADDPEFFMKSCPNTDPCARTKAHWVSPQRMKDRFQAGRLGNAKGKVLPLNIKRMLTKRWNEDHGVVGKDIFDCGDHWWCNPLKVSTCGVSYFLCVGEVMGYDNAVSTTLHCGGLAFIVARSGAPPVAVGVGAGGCVYSDIGHVWGWW